MQRLQKSKLGAELKAAPIVSVTRDVFNLSSSALPSSKMGFWGPGRPEVIIIYREHLAQDFHIANAQ